MASNVSNALSATFITLGRMLVPERGRFAKEMRRLRVGEADRRSAE